MSRKVTGVHQRHRKSCDRQGRCRCPWAYYLSWTRSDGLQRQETKAGFPTQGAAKEARAARQADLASGKVLAGEDIGITVGDWLDRWLASRCDPHGEREPLRPSTANGYRRIIDFYLADTIGRVRLRDLRAAHVKEVYRQMRKRGLTEGTVRNVHAVLRAATREAVRQQVIAYDPMGAVVLRKITHAPIEPWTPEQWRTFANGASSERLWPCWLVAADGGLRRGELAGLRWSDVDLDAGVITVTVARVQVGTEIHEGEPKTNAGTGRKVHLSAGTIEVLRALRKTQAAERLAWGEAHKRSELVFVMEDGSAWKPDSISQAFQRKAKALKLPVIRLHDLRHLSASLGAAAGESMLAISKRLGHSTPMFTAQVYTHLFAEQIADDASRRGELLGHGPSPDLASGGSEN